MNYNITGNEVLDVKDSSENSFGNKPQESSIPTCVVPTSNVNMDLDSDSQAMPFIPSRKQREFIMENNKDEYYWEKRRKNNVAARRSREKRRNQDLVLENRITDLTQDNCLLRNELYAIKKKFGIPTNENVSLSEEEHTNVALEQEAGQRIVNDIGGNSGQPIVSTCNILPTSRTCITESSSLTMSGSLLMAAPNHKAFDRNSPIPLCVDMPTSEGDSRIGHREGGKSIWYSMMKYQPLKAHIQTFEHEEDYDDNDDAIEYGLGHRSGGMSRDSREFNPSSLLNHGKNDEYMYRARSSSFTVGDKDGDYKGEYYDKHTDYYFDQKVPLSLTMKNKTESNSGNDYSNNSSSS